MRQSPASRTTQTQQTGHHIPAVFSQALIIEAIYLRDLSAFMVTSDQCDAVRIAHLPAQNDVNANETQGVMKQMERLSRTVHAVNPDKRVEDTR